MMLNTSSFLRTFSVCYKSHLTWYKLEQGCDAKHLFSQNFLMQEEWGLHDDLDQSLVMGMKPTFLEHMAALD